MSQVTVGLSFLAGLASFLSPCVLSLVPAYVGYLGGQSIGQKEQSQKLRTFLHGVVFAAGFSLVFIILGISFAALGNILQDVRDILSKIGGTVVILLGLHMAGLLRIGFLEFDARVQTAQSNRMGYLSSFLMGVSFSAGWSPCIGPVLGAILTLVLNEGNISSGAVFLSAYSLGMAIPFLIAAAATGWVTNLLVKQGKVMHMIEVVMGILMIILGLLLFMGLFERLAALGTFVDFGL
ncbi:MAG TPA: cytochrome c biogenesis protein CcdA [Anaerolineaceae bacterium]|nr:cytochrome c biogenesis protein CcdA [Anaerolineaceae bacterium]